MTAQDNPASDARMDPWCIVPLVDGTQVLFGFAMRHPVTGGLGWTRSTPVESLDATAHRASTASGRRYELGRRVEPQDIPSEGEEAWIAFDLLIGLDAADGDSVPPISADPERDGRWVAACKIARHLRLVPPGRAPALVERFLALHATAYVASRVRARRQ
jgi:hypothetical protein